MLTLAIDASTAAGSVALLDDGTVVAESTALMRGEHEERLMPAVVDLLESRGWTVRDLDAVACGGGPGSFTSLRIAAAIAKGLVVTGGLALFVAPSPLLIVTAAPLYPGAYIAEIGAMRGDVFALEVVVDDALGIQCPGPTHLMSFEAARARATSLGARLVGPDIEPPVAPHARGFGPVLRQRLATAVDAAAWEPDYGRKAEAQVRWERAHGRALESP